MIENEGNNRGTHMITFEYMQELSKLSKEELKRKIDEMNEGEAKELLFSVLCAMFRHDRVSEDEIAEL